MYQATEKIDKSNLTVMAMSFKISSNLGLKVSKFRFPKVHSGWEYTVAGSTVAPVVFGTIF